MPVALNRASDISPGEIYEDPFFHPCLCIGVGNGEVTGISLIDGTYPRTAHVGVSDVRKLTVEEAWHWRRYGPRDAKVSVEYRWWR